MNIRKIAAVWAAAGVMALAVSCAEADSSGEASGSVSTESLSEEISEVTEEMPDDTEENSEATEEISDDTKDISEIFTYRIIDGYVRIVKYKGTDPVVVIPDLIEGLPVNAVGESAFSDSTVTELTLPAGIENVSARMINNTEDLQYIYISGGSENYISVDGVIYTSDGKTLVMYPGGRTGAAEFAEGVTRIGDRAFYGCKIESVTLPDTVEVIGTSAFKNCRGLVDITIPGNVKTVGAFSFSESGLENVTLSEGVKSIGTAAFERTEIMEIYLPDSMSSAGEYILGSGERGERISVCKPIEGLKSLEKYEKISYRNETALEGAVRTAGKMTEGGDKYKAYLTDIDGDDFPEMLFCRVYKNDGRANEHPKCIYRYSSDKRIWTWEEFISPRDFAISVYRDRESGGYAEITSVGYGETGDVFLQAYLNDGGCRYVIGEAGDFYPINGYYYSDNDGYMTYFEGGGKFEIYEDKTDVTEESFISDETAFAEFIRGTVDKDRYEPIGELNLYEMHSKLREKYPDRGEGLIICGDFADSPDPEKADIKIMGSWDYDDNGNSHYIHCDYYIASESDEPAVSVGDYGYTEYACKVYLNEEDINEEYFEKLSALPCLTSLYLYAEEEAHIDLTGIDKLKNLKHLSIRSWDRASVWLTNTECLKNMDIQWLRVTGNVNNADFMADLDKVRVLEIGDSSDRPDDFYAAVADMDSLEYITVSMFGENITGGQEENIRSLRPDVAICYYAG